MIFDDGFNYGYEPDNYLREAVPVLEINPHYFLHAGCGCIFAIPGPWIDGKPSGVISSGAEPTKVCRKHLRAHYEGFDIRFP